MPGLVEPVALPPNVLNRSYRGGGLVAEWRGLTRDDEHASEDWIAAFNPARGETEAGLSLLPDGRRLRELLREQPVDLLGEEHLGRVGPDPGFFVKLLDGDERLPIHCHPSREFAAAHFGSRYGKTEGAVVVDKSSGGGKLYLGFRRRVEEGELLGWARNQDSRALLDAMNEVHLDVGDAVLIPAGVPHALGAGSLIVEIQEPTDFSILLEWDRFAIDVESTRHGVSLDTAIKAVDRSAFDTERLERLITRVADPGVDADRQTSLLPGAAADYFDIHGIEVQDRIELSQTFSVMVGCDGEGTLTGRDTGLELRRGSVVLIPHSAGTTVLTGNLRALRCVPASGPSGHTANNSKEQTP